MAKTSCTVKFRNFQWNRSGYADFMAGSKTQAMVRDKANKVHSRVTASTGAEYVLVPVQGKLAKGYVVATADFEAMLAETRYNALVKALGSI